MPSGGGPLAPGTKSATAGPSAGKAINALGAGRPLAPRDRAFFEPRFGRDLSSVRIHEGAAAHKASQSIDARAFAFGNDIAFANGERARGGQRLMAHELAHVVQDEKSAHRTVHRACHDGKCDKCSGGVKSLGLSVLYVADWKKKSAGKVKKDFERSKKALKNCCIDLKIVDSFITPGLPVGNVVPKYKRHKSGAHKGYVDYGDDVRKTGLNTVVKKSKGLPVLVVKKVKGTAGGLTVTKAFDPVFKGRPYVFYALKDTNKKCPTIAHELWHMGGGLTHESKYGEMVTCKSDKVSGPYCAKVRKLA